MSRSLVTLALAFGLLLIGAWLFLTGPRTTVSPSSAQAPATSSPAEARVAEDLAASEKTNASSAEVVQRASAPAAPAEPKAAPRSAPRNEPAADDLRIRLVEASTGRPALSAEISLSWHSRVEARSGPSLLSFRGRTEGEHAELRVPRRIFRRITPEDRATGRLRIECQWLGTEPLRKQVSLEPWPTEPIEMRLPKAGYVRLRAAFEERRGFALTVAGPSQRASIVVGVVQGRSELIPCQLGAELLLEGELPDGSRAALLSAVGPQRPGEIRELEIVRAKDAPLLAMQVVDERGALLPRLDISMQRRYDGTTYARELRQRTDDQGWLRVGLGSERTSGELRLEHASAPARRGRIAFPADLEPGEHALGQVRLVEDVLLVRGRVVDPEQRSLSMALVTILGSAPETIDPLPGPVRTNREGSFEFWTARHTGTLALKVEATGYAAELVNKIPAGTIDLTVVMEAAARCEGQVRLPEGFPPSAIEIRAMLEPRAPRIAPARSVSVHPDREGKFALRHLPAGRLDLVFQSKLTGELAKVEGLELASGQTNRDPRIQGIALAIDWQPLRLRLVRSVRGRPASLALTLQRLSLAWSDAASHQQISRGALTDSDGRLEQWLPPTTSEVYVLIPGKLAIRVMPSAVEQELVVQDGWRVRLPVDLQQDSRFAGCTVWLESEGGASSDPALLRTGELEFRVPRAGRYRLTGASIADGEDGANSATSTTLFDYDVEITHDGQVLPRVVEPKASGR
jgi:hypothetical protein